MLKKLRRRFVAVSMALITAVLLLVFLALFLFNYQRSSDNTRQALERALKAPSGGIWHGPEIGLPGGREPGADILTFSVFLDSGESILEVRKGGVSLSEEILEAAVSQALDTEAETGLLPGLSLRFLKQYDGAGLKIAFADTSHETENLRSLLLSSLAVGLTGWAALFAITLLLSRQIIRPVERAWAQQRRFIADASHELKTPLTVILANIDLLSSHREEPLRCNEQWLVNTREEAEKMKGLVEDMLFLARSDAGREQPVLSDVNLSDITTSALLSFEPVAFENGVALDAEVQPELHIEGDRTGLQRLLAILLDNAIKYAGSGGRVLVTLSRSGGKPLLRVQNTGESIPAGETANVFDRFYRADRARSSERGGYGLGLSIAKEIADQHKARIELVSSQDGLTVFQVLF